MLASSFDHYLDHFKLTAEPFSLTPDPDFLYLSPAHAEALAALTLGVTGRNGVVVLSGEVGTGKTTLLYSLLRTIGDGMRTAFVSSAGLGFDDLLRLALADFGVTSPSPSRFDSLATLNAMLRECASHGRTALLIVDEAQHLTDEDFEQLRLLTNFETFTEKLLQIVLVGQPELEARLRTHALRALTERVAVHCQLTPLGSLESGAYVDYRLLRVGGTTRLFQPAARDLLFRWAQGVPRRINILFHNALLFAYGRGDAQVTVSSAQAAVEARVALMELPDLSADAVLGGASAPRRGRMIAAAAVAALVGGCLAVGGWQVAPVSEPAPLTAPALDRPAAAEVPVAAAPQVVPAVDPVARAAAVTDENPGVAHASTAAAAAAVTSANDDGGSTVASAPVADAATFVAPAPPSVHGAAAVETTERAAADPPSPDPLENDAAPVHGRIVRVRSGQTLAALARRVYGQDDSDVLRRIQSANPQIVDPDHILAGDVLHFPGDGPADPASEKEDLR